MKFQLFKVANGYQAFVYDETKMIPDPQFTRKYDWAGVEEPVQGASESAADFQARQAKYTQARADQEAMIEREAVLRYTSEFNPPATVLLSEKVIP